MTHPPPAYPAPGPAPVAAQSPNGRGGMGRVMLVALLVGGLVAVVTGTAGFFVSRTMNGGDSAVRCGGGALCFAAFEAAQVDSFLASQGFQRPRARHELVTSSVRYEVGMARHDQWVRRYEVNLDLSPNLDLPEPATELLTWFAVLPFGDDADGAAEAQTWLATHLPGNGESTSHSETIGGFDYVLVHRVSGNHWTVVLEVRAGDTWL